MGCNGEGWGRLAGQRGTGPFCCRHLHGQINRCLPNAFVGWAVLHVVPAVDAAYHAIQCVFKCHGVIVMTWNVVGTVVLVQVKTS